MMVKRGIIIAGVIAGAVALGAPAPAAQAEEYCFANTGTPLDDRCVDPDRVCVTRTTCVEGVWTNVDGVLTFVNDTTGAVEDLVPERVCTPVLFGAPICVTN
jgi:hypothetical protein